METGVIMMTGTISILGLYNYDNNILDGISEGLPDVSAPTLEDVKQNILQECAELEVVISNPVLLKTLIGYWAKRKARGWARYYAAIAAEYNPLENYDRQESFTEQEIGNHGTSTETDGSTSETHDYSRIPNLTTENKVSAYNESAYQPHDQTTHSGTDRDAGTLTGTSSLDSETSGTYGRSKSNTNRIHGNIGVTTSQQMLQSELDLVDRLDLCQKITEDFKREFCIMVY